MVPGKSKKYFYGTRKIGVFAHFFRVFEGKNEYGAAILVQYNELFLSHSSSRILSKNKILAIFMVPEKSKNE